VNDALPAQSPGVTLETQPFWDATRDGRLVLPRCDDCEFVIWYPRRFCPACGSRNVSWFDAAGTATVYTYTIVTKGAGTYRDAGPYVVAFVELDEGPRMMTNIVDTPPQAVFVGQRVRVVFTPTDDGTALPRFRPE
jgi:uncharacterized OB-fold protein